MTLTEPEEDIYPKAAACLQLWTRTLKSQSVEKHGLADSTVWDVFLREFGWEDFSYSGLTKFCLLSVQILRQNLL